ncbi:MAG: dTDP-4-amino-4,6-dideoxygalactose transaminase [Bacteroidetes bacterium]|nr:dTDP-4-amino-4,6-dideoxygalactose transaminase [Bacteroidota bacterium]
MIKFNKPYFSGKESEYIQQVIANGHTSGNGFFTEKCHQFFQQKYGFKKVLLTTSCTDALEMAAMLLNIQPGDEVIIPSFTFVSTALAFERQGAEIVFADSRPDNPGIDEDKIESLITPKTKAIVVMHYAGIACDMDKIMSVANKYNLFVLEDAALAIDSYYKGKPLGTIGHLACFSFHETKNIQCGEGGMLAINDIQFEKRAEIIWEKGTNRAEFFRGEINKYGWVDTGSSFLPSEITAAFLLAQTEDIEKVQKRRIEIWNNYYLALKPFEGKHFQLPLIPDYATNTGHAFYLIMNSEKERDLFIRAMQENGIQTSFHYQSLHKSAFYLKSHTDKNLPYSNRYSECLVRLPLYFDVNENIIIDKISRYFLIS